MSDFTVGLVVVIINGLLFLALIGYFVHRAHDHFRTVRCLACHNESRPRWQYRAGSPWAWLLATIIGAVIFMPLAVFAILGFFLTAILGAKKTCRHCGHDRVIRPEIAHKSVTA